MSFTDLKRQRASRGSMQRGGGVSRGSRPSTTSSPSQHFGTAGSQTMADSAPAERYRDTQQSTAALAGAAAGLRVEHIPGHGRGIVATQTIAPGDTLFALDGQSSVLSTTQVRERCHYCFVKGRLQRCSGCRFARYCGAACQRAAWPSHRDECPALRRWFAHANAAHASESVDLVNYEPGPAIRALAIILWDMQRNGKQSVSWCAFQSMQSHYGDFGGEQYEKAAQAAYRLAKYAWGDEQAPIEVHELISAVMRHNTNAFALADPQLDPIGVCISAQGALLNHSCEPNAVVVFPTAGSNSPPTRCKLHVIALRHIESDEEITISYVDIAEKTAERQRTLSERYLIDCMCGLCRHTAWTDPREAMWCRQPGCIGWVSAPDWRQLPVDQETPATLDTGMCNRCGKHSRINGARDIFDRLVQAQALAKRVTDAEHAQVTPAPADYQKLRTMIQWSSTFLPPSNTLSWMLMYAAHVQAIEHAGATSDSAGLWDDATAFAFLLCAGMQARGVARDPRSALYPPGHPVRAVLLATLGKLLVHEPGTPPAQQPVAHGAPKVPQDRGVRLTLARGVLEHALGEVRVGFGHTSEVADAVRDALEAIDMERAL